MKNTLGLISIPFETDHGNSGLTAIAQEFSDRILTSSSVVTDNLAGRGGV
jgi:hypothetical protein